MPGRIRVGRPTDPGDRQVFFEIVPDLLAILGFDGYLRDANTSWQARLAWNRVDLLRTPFVDLVHADDRAATVASLAGVRRGIFMGTIENRVLGGDGHHRRIRWSAAGVPARSKVYLVGRELEPMPLAGPAVTPTLVVPPAPRNISTAPN